MYLRTCRSTQKNVSGLEKGRKSIFAAAICWIFMPKSLKLMYFWWFSCRPDYFEARARPCTGAQESQTWLFFFPNTGFFFPLRYMNMIEMDVYTAILRQYNCFKNKTSYNVYALRDHNYILDLLKNDLMVPTLIYIHQMTDDVI